MQPQSEPLMTQRIFCQKQQCEADALNRAPVPGPLGERILKNIGQEAWSQWLGHQTMLINEYRLSLLDPKARAFLLQEMEAFLFGKGSSKPPAFQKPDAP